MSYWWLEEERRVLPASLEWQQAQDELRRPDEPSARGPSRDSSGGARAPRQGRFQHDLRDLRIHPDSRPGGHPPGLAEPPLRHDTEPRSEGEKRKPAEANLGAGVFRLRSDGRLELMAQLPVPGLLPGVGLRLDDGELSSIFGLHMTEMLDLDELEWLNKEDRGLKSTYSPKDGQNLLDKALGPEEVDTSSLLLGRFCGPNSVLIGRRCRPLDSVRIVSPRPQIARALPRSIPSLRLRSSLDSFSEPLDSFGFDSAGVQPQHATKLPELARHLQERLKNHPQGRVEVVGHTDAVGPQRYNQGLGERRARAIGQKLIELGVPEASIEVLSEGEDRLRIDTPRREALNRRVEVRFRLRSPGRPRLHRVSPLSTVRGRRRFNLGDPP